MMQSFTLLQLLWLVSALAEASNWNIPGTTMTLSGYDTELGRDPICWKSHGDTTSADGSIPFPNDLVDQYQLQGSVELLRSCPANNTLQATSPVEFLMGERLRTGVKYNYSLEVELNLYSLGGSAFVSDAPHFRVSSQVIVCSRSSAGFCSPFIHEQSNARLAAQGIFTAPPAGESHGGTHVHSPRVFRQLLPEDGPYYRFTEQVPLLVDVPGDYFAIAAVQLFIADTQSNLLIRYDMANALPDEQRLPVFQEPPVVLTVPLSILVVSYVSIGLVSAILVFLLYHTIKYRDHQVLQLTQGCFLIVFLLAALVATVSSFLLEPKNTAYCQAGAPIVLISLQLVFAITIGRLWRINAVISPLLMNTLRHERGWKTQLLRWARKCTFQTPPLVSRRFVHKSVQLRRQITWHQLALVVALFTLPQVIIQVLSLVLQPRVWTVDFNEDESVGRAMCDSAVPISQSILYYGYYSFILLMVILLVMAHATRGLPSLFNETQVIFDATVSSLVVLILGLGVIFVTRSPTTSPGVEYFVWVLLIQSLIMNTTLRIMLPKLRMVWRNETVLVSKLVSDHARSRRSTTSEYHHGISGLRHPNGSDDESPPTTLTGHTTTSITRTSGVDDLTGYDDFDESEREHCVTRMSYTEPPRKRGSPRHDENSPSTPSNMKMDELSADQGNGSFNGAISGRMDRQSMMKALQALPSQRNRILCNQIVVTKSETPARRLVLKMVDMQEHLARVNERIMSGVAVSEEDWRILRRMAGRLGDTFRDEVQFDWEKSEDLQQSYSSYQGYFTERLSSNRNIILEAMDEKNGSDDGLLMEGDEEEEEEDFAGPTSLELAGGTDEESGGRHLEVTTEQTEDQAQEHQEPGEATESTRRNPLSFL